MAEILNRRGIRLTTRGWTNRNTARRQHHFRWFPILHAELAFNSQEVNFDKRAERFRNGRPASHRSKVGPRRRQPPYTGGDVFPGKGITFISNPAKAFCTGTSFFRSCCCAASSFQIAAATFRKSQIDHRPLSSHVGASPCAACRVGYFAAFLGHFLIPDRPSKTRRRPIIFSISTGMDARPLPRRPLTLWILSTPSNWTRRSTSAGSSTIISDVLAR